MIETEFKPTHGGWGRARSMGPESPPGWDLSGQRGVDCRTMGPQTIIEISVNSNVANNVTDKHHLF